MSPPPTLKESVIGRLQVFPLLSHSMLAMTFNHCSTEELKGTVDELVQDGVVKVSQYRFHRRTSPSFYLASEEERLKPYLEAKK